MKDEEEELTIFQRNCIYSTTIAQQQLETSDQSDLFSRRSRERAYTADGRKQPPPSV